jgi:hypothetical protein
MNGLSLQTLQRVTGHHSSSLNLDFIDCQLEAMMRKAQIKTGKVHLMDRQSGFLSKEQRKSQTLS